MIGGVVNDLGIDNVGVVLIINGKLSFGTIPTWTAMFVSLGVRTTLCGDANDFQWAIHDLAQHLQDCHDVCMGLDD